MPYSFLKKIDEKGYDASVYGDKDAFSAGFNQKNAASVYNELKSIAAQDKEFNLAEFGSTPEEFYSNFSKKKADSQEPTPVSPTVSPTSVTQSPTATLPLGGGGSDSGGSGSGIAPPITYPSYIQTQEQKDKYVGLSEGGRASLESIVNSGYSAESLKVYGVPGMTEEGLKELQNIDYALNEVATREDTYTSINGIDVKQKYLTKEANEKASSQSKEFNRLLTLNSGYGWNNDKTWSELTDQEKIDAQKNNTEAYRQYKDTQISVGIKSLVEYDRDGNKIVKENPMLTPLLNQTISENGKGFIVNQNFKNANTLLISSDVLKDSGLTEYWDNQPEEIKLNKTNRLIQYNKSLQIASNSLEEAKRSGLKKGNPIYDGVLNAYNLALDANKKEYDDLYQKEAEAIDKKINNLNSTTSEFKYVINQLEIDRLNEQKKRLKSFLDPQAIYEEQLKSTPNSVEQDAEMESQGLSTPYEKLNALYFKKYEEINGLVKVVTEGQYDLNSIAIQHGQKLFSSDTDGAVVEARSNFMNDDFKSNLESFGVSESNADIIADKYQELSKLNKVLLINAPTGGYEATMLSNKSMASGFANGLRAVVGQEASTQEQLDAETIGTALELGDNRYGTSEDIITKNTPSTGYNATKSIAEQGVTFAAGAGVGIGFSLLGKATIGLLELGNTTKAGATLYNTYKDLNQAYKYLEYASKSSKLGRVGFRLGEAMTTGGVKYAATAELANKINKATSNKSSVDNASVGENYFTGLFSEFVGGNVSAVLAKFVNKIKGNKVLVNAVTKGISNGGKEFLEEMYEATGGEIFNSIKNDKSISWNKITEGAYETFIVSFALGLTGGGNSNINIDDYVNGMSESDAESVRSLYEKVSTAYGKRMAKHIQKNINPNTVKNINAQKEKVKTNTESLSKSIQEKIKKAPDANSSKIIELYNKFNADNQIPQEDIDFLMQEVKNAKAETTPTESQLLAIGMVKQIDLKVIGDVTENYLQKKTDADNKESSSETNSFQRAFAIVNETDGINENSGNYQKELNNRVKEELNIKNEELSDGLFALDNGTELTTTQRQAVVRYSEMLLSDGSNSDASGLSLGKIARARDIANKMSLQSKSDKTVGIFGNADDGVNKEVVKNYTALDKNGRVVLLQQRTALDVNGVPINGSKVEIMNGTAPVDIPVKSGLHNTKSELEKFGYKDITEVTDGYNSYNEAFNQQQSPTQIGAEQAVFAEPTQEDIANDNSNKNFTMVKYDSEADIPDQWKSIATPVKDWKGKKSFVVQLPSSQFNYELQTGTSKPVTDYRTQSQIDTEQATTTTPQDVTVESAVIEIGGEVFDGKNHAEAILKAKASGKDISQVNRQAQGKFRLSDGTIIDRAEAKQRFGQDRSELMIQQDEASLQANKDLKKEQLVTNTQPQETVQTIDAKQEAKNKVQEYRKSQKNRNKSQKERQQQANAERKNNEQTLPTQEAATQEAVNNQPKNVSELIDNRVVFGNEVGTIRQDEGGKLTFENETKTIELDGTEKAREVSVSDIRYDNGIVTIGDSQFEHVSSNKNSNNEVSSIILKDSKGRQLVIKDKNTISAIEKSIYANENTAVNNTNNEVNTTIQQPVVDTVENVQQPKIDEKSKKNHENVINKIVNSKVPISDKDIENIISSYGDNITDTQLEDIYFYAEEKNNEIKANEDSQLEKEILVEDAKAKAEQDKQDAKAKAEQDKQEAKAKEQEIKDRAKSANEKISDIASRIKNATTISELDAIDKEIEALTNEVADLDGKVSDFQQKKLDKANSLEATSDTKRESLISDFDKRKELSKLDDVLNRPVDKIAEHIQDMVGINTRTETDPERLKKAEELSRLERRLKVIKDPNLTAKFNQAKQKIKDEQSRISKEKADAAREAKNAERKASKDGRQNEQPKADSKTEPTTEGQKGSTRNNRATNKRNEKAKNITPTTSNQSLAQSTPENDIKPTTTPQQKKEVSKIIEFFNKQFGLDNFRLVDINKAIKELGIAKEQIINTKDGNKILGFYHNGIIYLNREALTPETLFHETSHFQQSLIKTAAEQGDEKAQAVLSRWDRVLTDNKVMEQFAKGGKIKIENATIDLSSDVYKRGENETQAQHEERIRNEVWSYLIAPENANKWTESTKGGKVRSFINAVVEFFKEKLGLKDMTADEILNSDLKTLIENTSNSLMKGEWLDIKSEQNSNSQTAFSTQQSYSNAQEIRDVLNKDQYKSLYDKLVDRKNKNNNYSLTNGQIKSILPNASSDDIEAVKSLMLNDYYKGAGKPLSDSYFKGDDDIRVLASIETVVNEQLANVSSNIGQINNIDSNDKLNPEQKANKAERFKVNIAQTIANAEEKIQDYINASLGVKTQKERFELFENMYNNILSSTDPSSKAFLLNSLAGNLDKFELNKKDYIDANKMIAKEASKLSTEAGTMLRVMQDLGIYGLKNDSSLPTEEFIIKQEVDDIMANEDTKTAKEDTEDSGIKNNATDLNEQEIADFENLPVQVKKSILDMFKGILVKANENPKTIKDIKNKVIKLIKDC